MVLNNKISFEVHDLECEFRALTKDDICKDYINGLKEEEGGGYIQNIPSGLSVETQKKYIKSILLSKHNAINGIFVDGKLVGTAGIQTDTNFNKVIDKPLVSIATIGILIFNSEYRGLGLGSILVWASIILADNCIGVQWFGAAMDKCNLKSLRSFLSCGFRKIHERGNHVRVLLEFQELIKPCSIKNITINGEKLNE